MLLYSWLSLIAFAEPPAAAEVLPNVKIKDLCKDCEPKGWASVGLKPHVHFINIANPSNSLTSQSAFRAPVPEYAAIIASEYLLGFPSAAKGGPYLACVDDVNDWSVLNGRIQLLGAEGMFQRSVHNKIEGHMNAAIKAAMKTYPLGARAQARARVSQAIDSALLADFDWVRLTINVSLADFLDAVPACAKLRQNSGYERMTVGIAGLMLRSASSSSVKDFERQLSAALQATASSDEVATLGPALPVEVAAEIAMGVVSSKTIGDLLERRLMTPVFLPYYISINSIGSSVYTPQ